MAKIVEFGKFKIIKASAKEMKQAVGSPDICDMCMKRPETGFYIAVINRWLCPECFEDFKRNRKWYPEDAVVEQRNYIYYGLLLGVIK